MRTFDFGTVHVFVDTLEFELERLRRQAAQERALRTLEAERARPRRTARLPWHHRRPGTPPLSGAH